MVLLVLPHAWKDSLGENPLFPISLLEVTVPRGLRVRVAIESHALTQNTSKHRCLPGMPLLPSSPSVPGAGTCQGRRVENTMLT